MKYFLLVLFFSPLVLGGIDIFGGSSQGDDVDLPEGCALAQGGRCIRCLSAYQLDGAGCKKKEDEIPCDGKVPCDDAQLVVRNPQQKNKEEQSQEKNVPSSDAPQKRIIPDPVPASLVVPERNNQPPPTQDDPNKQVDDPKFSGTNNQEDGVDEADILKTDGRYIYTISRRTFSITRSFPLAQIELLHSATFSNAFYPRGLFIEGNFVTIFGSRGSNTRIYIYNVENKSDPKLIKTYEVEGKYFGGRKTLGGFVYIVSQIKENEERYAWLKVDNVAEDISTLTQTKKCIENSTLYYVNVLGFNLTHPSEYKAISARTININVLYMSENNIFLASNRLEKQGNHYESIAFIQKIFVKKSIISHHACQKVKGHVLNQFSMDEFEDDEILRIATTYTMSNQRDPIDSRVYCLNRNLKVISSETGIAPKEKIYSARYTGYRLYLVTFRRVDPFFVIEFDPHHLDPKVLGEVKITGYSSYLHLYDETTIIGIGKEVVEKNGRLVTNGVKFSIFDVSDPSKPIVVDTDHLTDPRIYSMVLQEHKAFFFSKQHNLMIIPATLNDKVNPFNGVLVFQITPTAIKFKTLIDHIISTANDNIYERQVQRILYIEDLLFTKSLCLLKVNNLYTFVNEKVEHLPCD